MSELDDARDACIEVERTGSPGDVIREMNDEIVDLRNAIVDLLKGTGNSPGANKKYAKARAALRQSRPPQAPSLETCKMNEVEKFNSETEALSRVAWLIENSYRVSIWWEGEKTAKVYCLTSYSMI